MSGGEKYMLSIASCLAEDCDVFIFWDKEKEAEIKREALRKLGIDLSNVKFYQNVFDKKTPLISRFIQSLRFNSIIYLSDGSIPVVGTKLYLHLQFPIEWVNSKSFKTRFKLSFVKDVFCNSYFTKYFVDRKLNINSKVVYPPVYIHRDTNAEKENVIITVGRFSFDKGSNYKKQDIMIDVFKKMIDKGLGGWELIMIVGIKDKDRESLAKLKKISNGYPIRIIENPSNEKLWENYSKAKIYWHATGFGEDLKKSPEKAEHFGISTVEAMGAGAVPVVFGAGGQREIVINGENGYFWNSLEELSDKTTNLIINKKLWEEMSISAVERSKIFSQEKFCKGLKAIIR